MRQVLHNILNRASWFFGALIVFLFGWAFVAPASFTSFVNNVIHVGGYLFQLALTFALCVVGINVILGNRPWWLGGGGKKKG